MAAWNVTALDPIYTKLHQAKPILFVLSHLFGGDSDLDQPADTEGVGVAVQCLARLLNEANQALMGITHVVPCDLRWRTMEASGLAGIMQEMLNANCWQPRFADEIMCGYFDAIESCVDRAINAKLTLAEPLVN